MIARVVTKRDDARLASLVTAAAAAFLLLVLADDAFHLALFRAPSTAMFVTIAVAIAMAGIAPWLAWSRRAGRVLRVKCENGVLLGRRLRIAARDVRALSVAPAAYGSSIAIEHGQRVTFVEVERTEDAERIAESLGAGAAKSSDVAVLPSSRRLAVVQVLLSLAGVVAAPLYYLATTHPSLLDPAVPEAKALFGIGGVIAGALSFLLLMARQWRSNHAVALGSRSAWETHAALHRERAARKRDATDVAVDDEAPASVAAAHVRVGNLGRGAEDVGAWLARIDALPSRQHAYRGDALAKEVLWTALGDGAAAVDTRMAAARVLRRRYGEEAHALVRVVDDPDVRLRVEAALDEHDDAERRIETLGPLFRARRLL